MVPLAQQQSLVGRRGIWLATTTKKKVCLIQKHVIPLSKPKVPSPVAKGFPKAHFGCIPNQTHLIKSSSR